MWKAVGNGLCAVPHWGGASFTRENGTAQRPFLQSQRIAIGRMQNPATAPWIFAVVAM
jgi:hypothetical protein